MAKILAPNRGYTGVSAGVAFCNGTAETDDPYLLEWFKKHGYEVEALVVTKKTDNRKAGE